MSTEATSNHSIKLNCFQTAALNALINTRKHLLKTKMTKTLKTHHLFLQLSLVIVVLT